MKNKEKLIIICNEKTSREGANFYCDNIDIKSIPEGLKNKFDILMIATETKVKRSYKINLEKILLSKNIFKYIYNVIKTFKNKNINYLIISITPYTFIAFIILFIFKKKFYVYLRSSGHEEYKAILGFFGPLIYNIMYFFINHKSNIISCQKRLTSKKKYDLVFPSEIDQDWLNNTNKPSLSSPKLLYVGRIRIEKGFFSLLKIFNEIKNDIELSVVGNSEDIKKKNYKINFLGFKNNVKELINIYDSHNITILPSYTEAHPKVVDESLARLRPVIIFEEINYVIQKRHGVFVAKRNSQSLLKVISFIIDDYENIQNEIKKNDLPTKEKFISDLTTILS